MMEENELENNYFEFLSDNLIAAFDFTDDENDSYDLISTTLAVLREIPEFNLRFYIDHLPGDRDALMNSIAYYCGIGEINIICDCCNEYDKPYCLLKEIEENEFFEMGKKEKGNHQRWFARWESCMQMRKVLGL